MKRIVLTGGGPAGHVTPNMALVPSLKEAGYDIQYIGSYNGTSIFLRYVKILFQNCNDSISPFYLKK